MEKMSSSNDKNIFKHLKRKEIELKDIKPKTFTVAKEVSVIKCDIIDIIPNEHTIEKRNFFINSFPVG
jgi:hypothetical protein